MKKSSLTGVLVLIAGAFLGLIFGCLVTWYPIRLLFCEAYHTPDCEEIVLITFPFYCLITPLAGVIIAGLLYRRRRKLGDIDGASADGLAEEEPDQGQSAGDVEEEQGHEAADKGDEGLAGDADVEALGGED